MKADLDHRKRDRERKSRYRSRLRQGRMIVPVEVNNEDIEMLIDLLWLGEPESENRRMIGEAVISALRTLRQK